MWVLLGLIGLVALILVLLYIPAVQDFVVPRVLTAISKPGEMEISAARVRLRFPLHLTADSLRFYTPAMEVEASAADLRVALTPLFTGNIVAEDADISGTRFRLGTPDSAMYMLADVSRATLDAARVHLGTQRVIVHELAVDSGLVTMDMRPDTVPRPVTADSVPVNWHITLDRGLLTRISYRMSIEPTITDLSCSVGRGEILDTDVDLRYNTVNVKSVAIDSADARYIYPTPAYLAAHPVPPLPADTMELKPTVPWTVKCTTVSMTNSRGLYAMEGARPLGDNLDLNYIEATGIDILIDSLMNRGTTVYVPIRHIRARERCGIPLELKGLFSMDSTALHASSMALTTPSSTILLDAMLGLPPAADSSTASAGDRSAASQQAAGKGAPPAAAKGAPQAAGKASPQAPLPFSVLLKADISNDDLRRLAPAPMAPVADGLPRGVPLLIDVDASGTLSDIDAREISLRIPRHLTLNASGEVHNPTDIHRAAGRINITGSMPDGQFLKPTLMDAKLARNVMLPPMTLEGDVTFGHGDISADLDATAADGRVALVASWRNRQKGYSLTLDAEKFPLQSILPALGVSDISGSVSLDGEGLDPFSPRTHLNGNIDLRHLGYKGTTYANITARADVADGHASLSAHSDNPGARLSLDAAGNLAGDTLRWSFDTDIRDLNLQALGLSDTVAEGSAAVSGRALFSLPRPVSTRSKYGSRSNNTARTNRSGHSSRGVRRRGASHTMTALVVDADIDVKSFYWRMPSGTVNASGIRANLFTDSARTGFDLDNGDLCLKAISPVPLDTLTASMPRVSTLLTRCMERRQLAVDTLQQLLPPFTLTGHAGPDNILSNYLLDSDISFDSLSIAAANDSLITLSATLLGLRTGETRLDSIALNMHQRRNLLLYTLTVDNRPGTFDQFAHINVKGYVGIDKFALLFKQENIKEETGYSFGSVVTMPAENTFRLSFVPYHPVIGYKDWEINRDNFLSYNIKTGHIDANVDLHSATSSLKLFTVHSADSIHEALQIQATDIKIQDWMAINPFAPPMTGDLSADIALQLGEKFKSIDGKGTVGLKNFYYGRDRVGDFDLELNLSTNAAGTVRASTTMMVDGVRTLTLNGNLNDSTAANPFNLDLRMIHFPLSVINPFMPRGTARLHGMLNGSLDLTGKMNSPTLNGWLQFDSTRVNVDMLGSTLDFSEDSIPVRDNILTLSDYTIKAVNENPIIIDGSADLSSLSAIKLALHLKANNTQVVGSRRKRGQDVYGKAYIGLDASVKGNLSRYLSITGRLDVLPGTNVTYVIPDVQSAIASRSRQQMVKFVNFADTAAVAEADSIAPEGIVTNIDVALSISQGSTIAVDLSSDGKNRAQIQAAGRVNYTSDYLGDERVTGRIDLNSGYVRYGLPPVMSEKTFNIREGSNVVFNGQMLNPTLNIHAYDDQKATVNDGGNSRLVTFDIGLNITGTLEQMNVVFDLSTNDDLTVQNELRSMSPDQRANQAMNMLLYGTYTGPGTKASTIGNPLYSFLEGQLNSLASSAIRGVDVSFGIDQLDRNRDGVSSQAMQYSYRVSKSLFDDRFKIIVGGNYTTDASADENFAQNLIADISFEYLLNKQGTMYVRLFRHTGYESILEGEITQTGVGFVYKKRIRTLRDLFRWIHRRKDEHVTVIKETPKKETPDNEE